MTDEAPAGGLGTVGPFRLVRALGQGGMGVVYEAQDARLGRRVALKMLLPTAHDRASRERLRREARIAASVRHPHVCQVYEVGEEGELWVAMELLDGEPLSARISRGPIPPTDAIRIALEVLSALAALHAAGIIHRDLKPSNVFLTSHGAKLLDFGLALPVASGALDERLTMTGTLIGTPHYMAPERWTEDGEAGPGSDLFAVGTILFEMVTGRVAYSGRTPLEIARSLSEPPPTLEGGSGVDVLDRVVRTSLARVPRDRYPTAEAMSLALSDASAAMSPSSTATAARPQTRVLVLPFRLLRPDPEFDFLSMGIGDAVTTALSGVESLVMRSAHVGARFDSVAPDLAAIAREAAVDVVLLGTLLRAGPRLRATVQLVGVPEGTVRWSATIDASIGDVLALQDEIVRRIVDSLSLRFSPHDQSGIHRKTPASPRANELYLRANQLATSIEKLPLALDLYRKSIEDDPRFAPAWARLGRVLRVMSKYGYPDAAENLRRADEAFRKALELDPELSLAHYLYSHYEIEEGGRARDAMVRLLGRVRARPAEADLFAALVLACRFCGLLDASLAADERARRLEPGIRTSVAFTRWIRGDLEEAMALDDEDFSWVRLYSLPLLGRDAEALEAAAEMESRATAGTRPMVQTTRAALLGDREACVRASRSLLDRGLRDPESVYLLARNLGKVGDVDASADLLARAVDAGFHNAAAFRRDPWLASLRADARFEPIAQRAEEGRAISLSQYRAAGGDSLLGAFP